MKNFFALLGLLVLIAIAGLLFLVLRNRVQPDAQPVAQPVAQATLPSQTNSPTQPVIKIALPANGARVRVGQAFQVHAIATDARGVAAIAFAVDGQIGAPIPASSPLATFATAIPITLQTKGVHTIAVLAQNTSGAKSDPAAIKVVAVTSLSDPANPDDPLAPAPISNPVANPSGGAPTISFVATPATIAAGQCSTLRWDVENVREVYFEGAGVSGHGEQQQCPAQTTTYALITILLDGSPRNTTATITVTGNAPQPQPVGQGPTAPVNLRVTSTTKTTARIAWDDKSSNEDGFEIEIEGRQNLKTRANETQSEITGLTCNRASNFRVRAFNATGNSAFSNQVTAQTLACDGDNAGAPAAPSNLRQNPVALIGKVMLAWNDNSNNETGFDIELVTDAGARAIATANANVTTTNVDAPACGATAQYQVSARNAAGYSAASNRISVQGAPCPSGFAVTNVIVTVNRATYNGPCPNTFTAGAKITASGAGTVKYRWERSDGVNGQTLTIQFETAGEKAVTNVDWSITSSGNYAIALHVLEPNDLRSNKGETVWTCASAQTQLPTAPTNLKLAGWSSSTLTLEWTDTANNEAGFELQRVTNESVGVLATVGAGTNKATVNKPPCGVAYSYRVVAKNSAGYSQPSNVLTVPAEACAPTPKPLVITGVKVTITPENFSGPCPYRVNYSGTISASAAGKVKYQWILDGEAHSVRELVFDGAGTKSVEVGTWTVKAGTHIARLKVLEPIDTWTEDKIGVFCSP
ncbi:MAG: hypothetical protein HZC40_25750 [Chloroflexi bacterium]|nr:hypothetical protein [Chloroflexota bacterium]